MVNIDYILNLNKDIEMFIETYRNNNVNQLFEKFCINETSKNKLNTLIWKMIDCSDSECLKQIEKRDNVCLKTIKLSWNGKLKEAMSFPVFDYYEFVQHEWADSSLRKMFLNTVYVFVVFKEDGNDLLLHRIKVWKMPEQVLENGVNQVWNQMKDCVLSGRIVKYIDERGRYCSYFPSSSDNQYVHVRPHAASREDTLSLPVPDVLTGLVKYPKHSFWLNRSYIMKIISED